MESSAIKQEYIFDDEINNELMQCCLLCQDGQKIYKELYEHFRKYHYEDYNQLPNDSIIQLCSCPDSIQLQYKLLNHMLSKALSPKSKIDSFQLIEEFKDEKILDIAHESIFENVKLETNEIMSSESSSDENFKKLIKAKRKRRKRAELTSSKSFTAKCDYCPRIFTKSKTLQNHYDLMHDPKNEFKCTKCNFGHCQTARYLNLHIKTHDEDKLPCNESKIKLFECDHCEMKFSMKNKLLIHISRHFQKKEKSKEKRLCQYCSKLISFFNLKKHIRTNHSDNRHIYKCDFDGCGKSFTESQTLKDHKNLHLGVKPYVCEFCSMSFAHIASLRSHKYRHTEPEKYKCQICNECFKYKKNLVSHVQRQHEDKGNIAKRFECDYEGCNSTFKYENYLQNHVRDVHIRKRTRVKNKNDRNLI